MTAEQIIDHMLAGAKCGRFGDLARAAEDVLRAAIIGNPGESNEVALTRWNIALQEALEDSQADYVAVRGNPVDVVVRISRDMRSIKVINQSDAPVHVSGGFVVEPERAEDEKPK